MIRILLAGCILAVVVLFTLASGGRPAWFGPSVQDRPLPGPPRDIHQIVALGTSLTARAAWPDTLAERLSDCFGHPVEMTRIAQVGMGSAWGEDQLARLTELAPDLVIMEFAINDADLLDGVSLARSRAHHGAILSGLSDIRPTPLVLQMTMSPATGLRGLVRPRLAGYYSMVRDLAEDADTGLADLYPRWKAAPKAIRIAPDGLHPTDAQTAEILLDPVSALISQITDTPCPRDM